MVTVLSIQIDPFASELTIYSWFTQSANALIFIHIVFSADAKKLQGGNEVLTANIQLNLKNILQA